MEKEKDQKHLIDSIVDSLGEALNEDIGGIDEIDEEIDDFFDENDEGENEELPKKIHRGFVTIAALMLIFSVIGVIASVRAVSGTIRDITDKKALKNEFALFVFPVVMNDPPAYDTIDSLQQSTIITCAIWKIILTGNKSSYPSEMGLMRVPKSDVEAAAKSLFGGIREFEHQSAGNFDAAFIYDGKTGMYDVPMNPRFVSYSPLVTEISGVGELYTVTIEYMPPSPLSVAGIEYDKTPVKTMIYTISRSKDKMTILSIKFSEQSVSNV